jgi:hypothetical protein
MRSWDSEHEQPLGSSALGKRTGLSHSLTSKPDDLDQQKASNQHGPESDRPRMIRAVGSRSRSAETGGP